MQCVFQNSYIANYKKKKNNASLMCCIRRFLIPKILKVNGREVDMNTTTGYRSYIAHTELIVKCYCAKVLATIERLKRKTKMKTQMIKAERHYMSVNIST